jgi:hypothetical protein
MEIISGPECVFAREKERQRTGGAQREREREIAPLIKYTAAQTLIHVYKYTVYKKIYSIHLQNENFSILR